ncbi:hypothetical protein KKH23_06160 [Patescibacteria group bacterium]|nr:hypothetical protein [Patescibacteria group bacterium]
MKLKIGINILILLLCSSFIGCGLFGRLDNISAEAKPYAVYQKSLEVFNNNLSTYIDTRAMVGPETQAKWKIEIEPTIDKVSDALDTWGLALAGGLSDAIAKAEYDKLYTQLLALLLKYKIVEVK